MDEYTKYYCGHNYAICEKWEDGDFAFDDPEFYNYLYRSFDKVVQIAKNKQKRFMLAEFGIHGRKIYFPPEKSSVMVSDIPSGFYDKKEEAEYALMACVEELGGNECRCFMHSILDLLRLSQSVFGLERLQ